MKPPAPSPPNQLAPDALLARLCADPCSPRSSQSAFRSLYTRVRYACALSAPSAASRLRTALFPPSHFLVPYVPPARWATSGATLVLYTRR